MDEKTKKDGLNNTDITKLSRELRATRIFCMVTSLLTALMLAGGIIFFFIIRDIQAETYPVIQQIAALDMESFYQTLDQLNITLESVDWEQVSLAVEQLDLDALNATIENLNTAELSEALENLNNAVDALEQIGQVFSKLTSLF